jgi:hypothetical protein
MHSIIIKLLIASSVQRIFKKNITGEVKYLVS